MPLVILSALLCSYAVASAESGRICLAPLPQQAEVRPFPWDIIADEGASDFWVQMNERSPVQLFNTKVSWISNLEIDRQYQLQIVKDKNVIESFSVRLADYEFADDDKKDLCLYTSAFYLSWQLSPVSKTGQWCPCWSSE